MASTLSGYCETYIDAVSLSPWPMSPGDIPMHTADMAPRVGTQGCLRRLFKGLHKLSQRAPEITRHLTAVGRCRKLKESRFASLDLVDCDWQGGNLPYEKNSK